MFSLSISRQFVPGHCPERGQMALERHTKRKQQDIVKAGAVNEQGNIRVIFMTFYKFPVTVLESLISILST